MTITTKILDNQSNDNKPEFPIIKAWKSDSYHCCNGVVALFISENSAIILNGIEGYKNFGIYEDFTASQKEWQDFHGELQINIKQD